MQMLHDDPVLFSKGLFWTPAVEHSLQAGYRESFAEAGEPRMKISTAGLLGADKTTRPSVSHLAKSP